MDFLLCSVSNPCLTGPRSLPFARGDQCGQRHGRFQPLPNGASVLTPLHDGLAITIDCNAVYRIDH